MPKKSQKPLEGSFVNFYDGDKETLKQFYGSTLGYGPAIREIVHNHCNTLRERASREGVLTNVGTISDELVLGLDTSAGGLDE